MINKRTPKLAILAIIAFAASLFASAAHAENLSVTATLILASNDGQGVDPSLKQYESKLLRAFPFDTFKKQGSGRTSLPAKGKQTISFPGGQTVTIAYLANEDGKYRLSAQWKKGSQTLTNMTVLANKGRPTVQAARNSGGTMPILILVAN